MSVRQSLPADLCPRHPYVEQPSGGPRVTKNRGKKNPQQIAAEASGWGHTSSQIILWSWDATALGYVCSCLGILVKAFQGKADCYFHTALSFHFPSSLLFLPHSSPVCSSPTDCLKKPCLPPGISQVLSPIPSTGGGEGL